MTVTVDPQTLRDAKALLRETGLTVSGFINLTLRGLVDSSSKPLRDMYEDMAVSLYREVTKTDKPQKVKRK